MVDLTIERLARLLEQIHRRRAEDEEAAPAQPAPPSRVDQPAQAAEELRHTLDLVEDDEFVLVPPQVELGLGELGPIGLGFEIEINGWPRTGHLSARVVLPT